MNRWFIGAALAALTLIAIGATSELRADEGMWLFSNPPVKQIKETYGVDVTPEMLEHLQKSCLKFASSGSSSFVSSDGLIMTNHHVGLATVAGLSTKERDLVRDGFYAENREDEIPCPGVELIALEEIVDVTARVEEAIANAEPDKADLAKKEIFAAIQKEANAEKGLRCEVVALYQGGRYQLYCYKTFKDVRLVFTPEESVGFFGGDPDNFEYPRYNLDVTFFRVYEDGKPYKPEHFLSWSENGAAEGDLVLVAGHPARTNRFNTVADLEYQRDVYYPHILDKYRRNEIAYTIFSNTSADNARRIATALFRLQNSRKNRGGIINGLQSPRLMGEKIAAEAELRKIVAERNLLNGAADPWDVVEKAMKNWGGYYAAWDLLEANEAFSNATIARARGIVRYLAEAAKPEAERLPDYVDAKLEGARNGLLGNFSTDDADLALIKLNVGLSALYEISKPADGGRKIGECFIPQADFDAIFGGVSPKARAAQIVNNSKLGDREYREALLNGGFDALRDADDPAIQLALAVEPTARALAVKYAAEVVEPTRAAYALIAKARFDAYGEEVYPDATFTLRLSYGKAVGMTEDDGRQIPFQTEIAGAYAHAREHNCEDPYDLAKSWFDAEAAGVVPMNSALNFITTNDTIGGNSGSPAVNANGEVIGLLFDGNIQSLSGNFIYDDVQSRSVLVSSQGIRDAVRYIYNLPKLADELGK
ncbi:MAG: S46 family peptidase [Thermoguttaceae bacterium]|nr:S46 family peptidase [Thermoguttaceae bacterium]